MIQTKASKCNRLPALTALTALTALNDVQGVRAWERLNGGSKRRPDDGWNGVSPWIPPSCAKTSSLGMPVEDC
jgi:hypothetical protein